MRQNVDPSSSEFKQGFEAGLNSIEDTRNWQAGNELGRELKAEGENKEPLSERFVKEPSIPLFMRYGREGNNGNPQDEKDEVAE